MRLQQDALLIWMGKIFMKYSSPLPQGRVHNFKRHGHMGQGRLMDKKPPEAFKNKNADPADAAGYADELGAPNCPLCLNTNSIFEPDPPAASSDLSLKPWVKFWTWFNPYEPPVHRPEKHMARSNALPPERTYILVGMDAAWFEKTFAKTYTLNTIVMAGLVALAGLAGLALLFLIHNYTLSRRMLKDTQVMSGTLCTTCRWACSAQMNMAG